MGKILVSNLFLPWLKKNTCPTLVRSSNEAESSKPVEPVQSSAEAVEKSAETVEKTVKTVAIVNTPLRAKKWRMFVKFKLIRARTTENITVIIKKL